MVRLHNQHVAATVYALALGSLLFCARCKAQEQVILSGNWEGNWAEFVAGQAVLTVTSDTGYVALSQTLQSCGIICWAAIPEWRMYMLRFPSVYSPLEICEMLEENSNTFHCTPDLLLYPQTADTYWDLQWHFRNTGQSGSTPGADIMLEEAFAVTRGSDAARLAVLDSGIPTTVQAPESLIHPDLDDADRITLGCLCYAAPNPTAYDSTGHGTSVLGVALAETDNGYGTAGVCPGCRGIVEKVTSRGNLNTSYAALAIRDADSARNANVISMSYGRTFSDPILTAAIDFAGSHGILLVFPSGNVDQQVIYPANLALTRDYVVAVGGTDRTDRRWRAYDNDRCFGACYGPELTVAAPAGGLECPRGECTRILTAASVPDTTVCALEDSQLVRYVSGTSLAAPMVAGIAGLLLSYDSTLSPSELKSLIMASSDNVYGDTLPDPNDSVGHGRVNAFKALMLAPGIKTLQSDLTVRKHIYSDVSPYRVKDGLLVPPGISLTLQPGVVLKFEPGAHLIIEGTLVAEGTSEAPIVLEASSESPWGLLMLQPGGRAYLNYCVVAGGDAIYLEDPLYARILNSQVRQMNIGVDAYGAGALNFYCGNTLVEDCELYGVRGTLSAGLIEDCTIRDCGRAGIYWIGDNPVTLEAPHFISDTIEFNGSGPLPIAGGFFSETTARLECSHFRYNDVNQILVENYGDIVMNEGYTGTAGNWLIDERTSLWCSCTAHCICASPPVGFAPLMYIDHSLPQLNYGFNGFHFDEDGTYLFDPCPLSQHQIKYNHFEPDNSNPGEGNFHFCDDESFNGETIAQSVFCIENGGGGETDALSGSESAYRDAVLAENERDFGAARNLYRNVVDTYPISTEAKWAARGYLRTGRLSDDGAQSLHDTLREMEQDHDLAAARREAVWALVAGQYYADAREELEGMQTDPAWAADSLWTAVMLEIITLLEDQNGPRTQRVGGQSQMAHQRIDNFHARLQALMGRPTDREVTATAASPRAADLVTAYPNPFNSTVTIRYELPDAGHVRLKIFNLLGQEVTTLIDDVRAAGSYRVTWDGRNASGVPVPSGMYLYRLDAGRLAVTKKMLLVR